MNKQTRLEVLIVLGVVFFLGVAFYLAMSSASKKNYPYTPEYYKSKIVRITEGKCEYLVCNWNIVHCGDCSNCNKGVKQ